MIRALHAITPDLAVRERTTAMHTDIGQAMRRSARITKHDKVVPEQTHRAGPVGDSVCLRQGVPEINEHKPYDPSCYCAGTSPDLFAALRSSAKQYKTITRIIAPIPVLLSPDNQPVEQVAILFALVRAEIRPWADADTVGDRLGFQGGHMGRFRVFPWPVFSADHPSETPRHG